MYSIDGMASSMQHNCMYKVLKNICSWLICSGGVVCVGQARQPSSNVQERPHRPGQSTYALAGTMGLSCTFDIESRVYL